MKWLCLSHCDRHWGNLHIEEICETWKHAMCDRYWRRDMCDTTMWENSHHIVMIRQCVSHCSVCLTLTHCDITIHIGMTRLCSSHCDMNKFVTLRHYDMAMFITLWSTLTWGYVWHIARWVNFHHIAMIRRRVSHCDVYLCSSQYVVTIHIKARCLCS